MTSCIQGAQFSRLLFKKHITVECVVLLCYIIVGHNIMFCVEWYASVNPLVITKVRDKLTLTGGTKGELISQFVKYSSDQLKSALLGLRLNDVILFQFVCAQVS